MTHQNIKWIQAGKQQKKDCLHLTKNATWPVQSPADWHADKKIDSFLYLYAWTRVTLLISADLCFICACLCRIYWNANWFTAHPFWTDRNLGWNLSIHPIFHLPLPPFSAWDIKARQAVISEGPGREAGRWNGLGIRLGDVPRWPQLSTQVVIKSLVIG